MKYLGGRSTSNKSLNPQFFAKVFEHCNPTLSKSLIKPLLKYLLPGQKSSNRKESGGDSGSTNLIDTELLGRKNSELSGMESGDSGSHNQNKDISRSNHQRLLAIEIFLQLIRTGQTTNPSVLTTLGDNFELISQVLVVVIKTADSW